MLFGSSPVFRYVLFACTEKCPITWICSLKQSMGFHSKGHHCKLRPILTSPRPFWYQARCWYRCGKSERKLVSCQQAFCLHSRRLGFSTTKLWIPCNHPVHPRIAHTARYNRYLFTQKREFQIIVGRTCLLTQAYISLYCNSTVQIPKQSRYFLPDRAWNLLLN